MIRHALVAAWVVFLIVAPAVFLTAHAVLAVIP